MRFFRGRVLERPSWGAAMMPVVLHGLLAAAAAIVSIRKGQAALAPAMGGTSGSTTGLGIVVGGLFAFAFAWFLFAMHAGMAVFLDVALAGSGRARRLVEFSGYAFLPSALWAATGFIALAVWWNPEPLHVPLTVPETDLARVVVEYQARLSQTPVQIVLRTVSLFVGLWLVALQAAALHVVSGFRVSSAVVSGIFMGLLLVVLPWVLGQ